MKIISSPSAMTAWTDKTSRGGKSIALVPTMGFFHEGHLCLMRLAATMADHVVVSLFVNPLQFGPREDLDVYPRDFEKDAAMAEMQGVDVLFAPEESEMYPPGFRTTVHVEGLTDLLCGARRLGHFDGVTTVVAKLFNIVRPLYAIFGEKDFQQLAVIRRLVMDLNWNVKIIGHPIVREADGLAMSSRNTHLSARERISATCLHRALQMARKLAAEKEAQPARLIKEVKKLLAADAGVRVEYVKLVDRYSLLDSRVVDRDTHLMMAVQIGRTRLIDNGRLIEGV